MYTIFSRILGFLILTSAIFIQTKASSISGLPLLNAYASADGTVKLLFDRKGYYALVDFSYLKDEEGDLEDSDNTGQMIIGLYTSKTWLGYNCLGFTSYDCSANFCNTTADTFSKESLPYFTASGYYASSSAYLDYDNWYLSQNAALLYSCTTGASYIYGENRTGILGMGVGNGSSSNFKKSHQFSIYLDPATNSGEITFSVNQDRLAYPGDTGKTFSANENWEMNLDSSSFIFEGSNGTEQLQMLYNDMIFDLGYPVIGLPDTIYTTFVQYFMQASGVECSGSRNYPTCYYNGTINNLPNITLNTQSQNITIPPQVYVQNGSTYDNTTSVSSINLNIAILSPDETAYNYVTPAYMRYIIMGSSFLSYYYATFDYNSGNPQITFRVASPPGPNLLWLYIVLAAAALIALIVCFVCIWKKTRGKKGKVQPSVQESLIPNTDGLYQNNQVPPPIYGSYGNYAPQQNSGYNYPQDGGNGYNQQPQGYYSSN